MKPLDALPPADLRSLVSEFRKFAAHALEQASEYQAQLESGQAMANEVFKERSERLEAQLTLDSQSATHDVEAKRKVALERYEREYRSACRKRDEHLERAQREHAEICSSATRSRDEVRWEAGTLYDSTKSRLRRQQQEAKDATDSTARMAAELRERFDTLVRDLRHDPDSWPTLPASEASNQGQPTLTASATITATLSAAEHLSQAEALLERLKALRLPYLFQGVRPAAAMLVVWIALAIPLLLFAGLWPGLPISVVAAAIVCTLLGWQLYGQAKKAIQEIHRPFGEALAAAEKASQRRFNTINREYQAARAKSKEQKRSAVKTAEAAYRVTVGKANRQLKRRVERTNAHYTERSAAAARRRDDCLRVAEQTFANRAQELTGEFTSQRQRLEERLREQSQRGQERYDSQSSDLATRWNERRAGFQAAVGELAQTSDRLFPAWDDPSWHVWQPAQAMPALVRFGQLQADLNALPGAGPASPLPGAGQAVADAASAGKSEGANANAGGVEMTERFQFPPVRAPALLTFPDRGSLVIRASGAGRKIAAGALQAVMLRMLARIPPGKIRFTIFDPVGLGQNFAGFMHLADYDESLITSRIWTEQSHIEQRLSDLTEQMETIIQKYLRNEFPTIADYNAQAGEMAEPLRVLVVAGFPANFTDAAARRLVSIAASGPRCGVYILVAADTASPMPHGFNLADLAAQCVSVSWRNDQFAFDDPILGDCKLSLDGPPPDEVTSRLVRLVGENARSSQRVEVPFEVIAPAEAEWWTHSSAGGVRVPLGPCGATRRQYLQLGQGTAQHVLVAGKTGSGKSSLLHALITNMALSYGPDEVHLYLVDFKKGVEFKTYATHELAHLRVLAIESDREFGVSVLERLDAELNVRGEAFRSAGVQDVSAFRHEGKKLPRILLIVDEFQEFFVEDDRAAQTAALLLDRLVRQGRAFGIHVLLGSQTLGGAYSLARSTLGQMAVRIALQCSEADAHLILSEDNTAARLLSRPGEAIYNDAGGLIEGNQPFQVAWLPDTKREGYLTRLRTSPPRDGLELPSTIVFEGNVPAELSHNQHLVRWQKSGGRFSFDGVPGAPSGGPPGGPSSATPRAWLGDAVAIKDHTTAYFPRAAGRNLLLVGQHPQAALGVFTSALVSLAAQYAASCPPSGAAAPFYLCDGSLAEPSAEYRAADLVGILGNSVRLLVRSELPAALEELSQLIARRHEGHTSDTIQRYLFLYDLGRLRDLRKSDDDLMGSFSRSGAAPSPAAQLGMILRDGPAVGVHVITWCDTLNNLNRALDRQTLRELGMRVLFQMSAADSSHLIDSPAASRLGLYRALLASEDEGRLEKFRPYGPPSLEWLSAAFGK